MRKSLAVAIAVEAMVLVVAIALSIACIGFGVGERNEIANLTMILLLVVVSGALMLVYWLRSMQRDEMVRRFFVSPEWVYNHEIGYAPLRKVVPDGDAYRFVTFAADSLANMSYGGFEVADTPADFKPEYLIDSRVFHFHFIGDEDGEGEAAAEACEGAEIEVAAEGFDAEPKDEANAEATTETKSNETRTEGVVVDSWQGTLQRIEHDAAGKIRHVDVGTFGNARDLARLLEDNDAFGTGDLDW